jgi:hypothetical protein
MQIRLLILFILAGLGLKAQVWQLNSAPYNYAKGLRTDSLFLPARGCDTTFMSRTKYGASTTGAIYVDTCNGFVYRRAAFSWVKVSIDAGDYIRNLGIYENKVFNIESGTTNQFTTNILNVLNFASKYDTVTYKPVVVNTTTGKLDQFAYWPSGGGVGSTDYVTAGVGIKVDSAARVYTVKADTGRGTVQVATGGGIAKVTDSLGVIIATKEPAITAPYTTNKYWTGYKTFGSFFDTARAAFSLTTTGTSGAATYNSSTGAWNIPQYQAAGSYLQQDSSVYMYYGAGARNIRTKRAGGLGATQYYVNSVGPDSTNFLTGYLAGNALTSGYRNVLYGDYSGQSITSGFQNTFLGYASGLNCTTCSGNVALGLAYFSTNNKTGSNNVAIGTSALISASSISNAVAVGNLALSSATTSGAVNSIAVGSRALRNITTGNGNVAVTNLSDDNQMGSTSSDNTHIGSGVGAMSNSTTVIARTTFVGAGSGSTSGNNNSGFGAYALRSSSGASNIGIGYYNGTNGAAVSGASGTGNIGIGAGGRWMSQTASNQVSFWAGASTTDGTGGYNTLSRDSSGRWLFNITTSAVTAVASGAALEINGTGGGFLIPRGTSSNRTSIASPATGLQYYDTDSSSLMVYNGSRWQPQDKADYINSTLGSPVTMTTAATFYTGATVALTAGTWLLVGQITFTVPGSAGTHTIEGRIYNGSAAVASGNQVVPASGQRPATMALNTVVVITGNTTYTLDLTSNVNSGQINAVTVTSSQAAATQLTATRIR